jgi:WD40 repeat protein
VDGHRSLFLCFSADSRRLAWVNQDVAVRLWKLPEAVEVPIRCPPLTLGWHGLAFYPDGRLTYVSRAGSVEAWDVEADRQAFSLGGAGAFTASQVAVSPDGHWFAGVSQQPVVWLWDTERRRPLFTLPRARADVWSMTWSPDGRLLVLGLADGGLVIWDLVKVREHLARLELDW